MITISTAGMTYIREKKIFVTECSNLPGNCMPDSFLLRSAATGECIPFVWSRAEYDQREGELQAYIYVPQSAQEHRVYQVHVFND